MASDARYVLPSNVRPTHYHLAIVPDLAQAVFSGEVTIDLNVVEPTTAVTLNAVGLAFTSVSAKLSEGKTKEEEEAEGAAATESDVSVLAVVESPEDQRIILQLSQTLPAASALQLHFVYTAKISDTLFAFYRSHYTVNGEKKYVGATQLCPAEARRVFPCWDEPSLRATFSLDMTVDAGVGVWCNSLPTSQTALPSGQVRWAFAFPYTMPTYLLAWVVGEMEMVEMTVPHHSVPLAKGIDADADADADAAGAPPSFQLRAVTAPGKVSHAAFGLSVAAKVLPLYEDYFQCRYVLPKMDLIALPNFAFGAMENWGCVTFREQTLLVAEDGSDAQRERVATVVAHELAHQWFGNLATMAWWSDLWLNESFATYMATWSVNKLFPEWAADTQFVFDEGSRAFQLDALRSSHPIEMVLRDVREVDGIFDAISYSKGAMVLRMTAKFVGEAGLQKGLMRYLSRYAFAAATSAQLWESLSGPATPNLKSVLQSWTQVQGYPYLQASYNPSTQQLTLTQNRFLAANDVTPEENTALWQIPMYYTYSTGNTAAGGSEEVHTVPLLMVDRSVTVHVPNASWVKVNSDQIAFCRVHYTDEMLHSLVRAVESKAINDTDRYSLIADVAAFARGGYGGGTVPALTLLAHYGGEDGYVVWCAVVEFEKKLRTLLSEAAADVAEAFNAYCRRLYRPAMERLHTQPAAERGYRAQQVEALLYGRLLACGDVETLRAARTAYTQRATHAIPASLVQAVYSLRVCEGGPEALAEVKQLVTATDYAELRTHYLGALAAVPDPKNGVPDLVNFLLSDAVPNQDVMTVMAGLAARPDTQGLFAEQVMTRWPQLSQKLPSVLLTRLVKMIEHGSDAGVAVQLQTFFAGELSAEMQARLRMTFLQGIEGLLCNAAWAKRDGASIAQYLLSQKWN